MFAIRGGVDLSTSLARFYFPLRLLGYLAALNQENLKDALTKCSSGEIQGLS